MRKTTVITVMGLLASSCASQPLTQAEMDYYRTLAERDTFTIDCPAGCSVAYRDPNQVVHIPRQSNGWDVIIRGLGTVESIAPIAGMGWLGTEAVRSMRNHGQTTTTNISNRSTDIQTNRSTAIDNSVGDYSGSASGNSGRVNSPDTREGFNRTDMSTRTTFP